MGKKNNLKRNQQKHERPQIQHWASDPEPFLRFSNYVDEQRKKYVGRDTSDNCPDFVPPPVLREYWTASRISKVQKACRLSFNINTIRERYLRTFSTLVFSGQVSNLAAFTGHNLNDGRLPLKEHPAEWPKKDPHYQKLFSDVFKHQWLFFPLIFAPSQLEDRILNKNRALPIEAVEQIKHGDAAVVQKIVVHDSCNQLVEKDQNGRPFQREFVLKTYHRHQHEGLYDTERNALRMLNNLSSKNVVTYYGSFRQNGSYNLILEYADGGTLADLYTRAAPPKGGEVLDFWKSLAEVLKGLDRVHHLRMNVEGVADTDVNGIHEDIKPENILLFKGNSKSPYRFTPKISDFGLFSQVKESKTSSSRAMALDNHGTQLYSSPECSHHAAYQRTGPNMINTRADIFSLGAVLSDACAWIAGGRAEQKRYLKDREKYHQGLRSFRGSDYEGCFHDGNNRLPIVDEAHKRFRELCKSAGDDISPRIMDIIEEHVLLSEANDRLNAQKLMEKLDQVLGGDGFGVTHCAPCTVELDKSEETVTFAPAEVTLAALGERISRQGTSSTHNPFARLDDELEAIIRDLKINVPDRDHFFLVDDSINMGAHSEDVNIALQALFQVTKKLDPNRLELAFASAPRKVQRSYRPHKLVQLVSHHPYRREAGLMENCIAQLLDCVIVPRLPMRILGINFNLFARKPTSIYIFTDGNWGFDSHGKACGVERPLIRLREELKKRRLDKNQVTFHFVRLGEDEAGRNHLDYLDKFGRNDGNDWDMVDVKSVTSSIHSIVLGPISQKNDDSGE